MEGKYEYSLYLEIGLAIGDQTDTFTVEDLGYDRGEWDAIADKERTDALDEYAREWMFSHVEYGWK